MENKLVGIYAFHSQVSSRRYIGQSRNLEVRRKEHIRSLARGDHHSRHLQRSYLLHGKESISYSVLEYCEIDVLTAREQYWLDWYRSSGIYNSAPAADSNFGVKWSDEARELRSISQRGRKHSEEAKEKISTANLGRKLSDGHIEKMRLTRIGKIPTAEARAKMSAARRGRKFTSEHIANMNTWKVGKKHDPESIEKMRLAKLGKFHSQVSIEKIRAAATGRLRSPESIQKATATRLRNKLLKQAETA